jgi:hypothetical protein
VTRLASSRAIGSFREYYPLFGLTGKRLGPLVGDQPPMAGEAVGISSERAEVERQALRRAGFKLC